MQTNVWGLVLRHLGFNGGAIVFGFLLVVAFTSIRHAFSSGNLFFLLIGGGALWLLWSLLILPFLQDLDELHAEAQSEPERSDPGYQEW